MTVWQALRVTAKYLLGTDPPRGMAVFATHPAGRSKSMAFPPNYRQERSNRERAKQRKALEKQQKRMEKSGSRKDSDEEPTPGDAAPDSTESVKE
jgi:hypothetical protein